MDVFMKHLNPAIGRVLRGRNIAIAQSVLKYLGKANAQ